MFESPIFAYYFDISWQIMQIAELFWSADVYLIKLMIIYSFLSDFRCFGIFLDVDGYFWHINAILMP